MSVAPDIRIDVGALGGGAYPVRTYFIPRCLRCGWCGEPAPTASEARETSDDHLTLGCLAEVGGGE